MQHQFWITKQTLSRKLGRKEDACIIASDALLDTKLELFRNIQASSVFIQEIINKYQESICYLTQEMNSMGRFLKETCDEDETDAKITMSVIGKSLIFCTEQLLILHEPLIRFYREVETFHQRAIEDTLKKIISMEKARTEYRASLSWMKNVSQQLDPDTLRHIEKFKKVQNQVRRGKSNFDKLAHDCLQKVDLLAAARCNLFNHTLSFYQKRFSNFTGKSAGMLASTLKISGFDKIEETFGKANSKAPVITDVCHPKKSNPEDWIISDYQLLGINDSLEKCLYMESNDRNNTEIIGASNVSGGVVHSSLLETTKEMSYMIPDTDGPNLLPADILDIDENSGNGDLFLTRNKTSTPHDRISQSDIQLDETDDGLVDRNSRAKSWLDVFEELDSLSNYSVGEACNMSEPGRSYV